MSHTGGNSGSRASHRANSSVVSTKGFDPGRGDFTIADVLAWARTKPARERYDYLDPNNCAVALFGRETGRAYLVGIGSLSIRYPALYDVAAGDMASCELTFGALAERCEAALATKPTNDAWTKADAYLTDELAREGQPA
jgi:hypothetical protein